MLTNPQNGIFKLPVDLVFVVQVPVKISWVKKNTNCYARESHVYLLLIMKVVETKLT